jgi:mRNA interferase RelE/StbE
LVYRILYKKSVSRDLLAFARPTAAGRPTGGRTCTQESRPKTPSAAQTPRKRLAKAEARRILDQIDHELAKKPDSNPALKGQFAGLRKYHIGDYRVIYSILDDDVAILRIGHRRDVYKKRI